VFGKLLDTRYLAQLPNELKARWCLLRSIEWGRWPFFVSQPLVPVALVFFKWSTVVFTLIVLTWLWALVRYRIVSLSLAEFGATFVHLKWPSSLIVAGVLAFYGNYSVALLAGLWPLAASFLQFLTPRARIGDLEQAFAYQIMAMGENFL
jgi:hypothetical protein